MSHNNDFNNTVSYKGTHWKSPEHDLIYKKKKKINHAYTPNDLVILITHFFLIYKNYILKFPHAFVF